MEKKLIRFFRGVCRILANHCIIPSLRKFLFKCSGFLIGREAFVNMGVWAVDDYEKGMVIIGDRASIAPNVTFIAISSPNNSKIKHYKKLVKKGKIRIENDVWVGAGVTIMPGVQVAEFSVIGSNTVVTKNIESYSIVVGNPARKIGDVRDKSD